MVVGPLLGAAVAVLLAAGTAYAGSAPAGLAPTSYPAQAGHAYADRWQVLRSDRADDLAGVSCPRASRCVAVGGYFSAADVALPLAEVWDGRSWRLANPTVDPRATPMEAVSCATATFCIATSIYPASPEAWNGTTWRPLTTSDNLYTVSCASSSSCVGIDNHVEEWTGHAWRQLADLITPAGAQSIGIYGLSCAKPNRCMAVGASVYADRPQNTLHNLAEEWDGSSWRLLRTPDPVSGDQSLNQLSAVSCARPARCMAVGYDNAANSAVQHNLSMTWNGKTWRLRKIPGRYPFEDFPVLFSISCPAASDCMTVGNYATQHGTVGHNLAESWNGKNWRVLKTPGPGGGLHAVSCARAARCIAVGTAGHLTLAEMWNGTRWRLLKTRNP
jgi:hypothetical protein